MKNILVSGASGIVGYGILKSLQLAPTKINLIGIAIYPDSAAQGFCDHFELAPRTEDPTYLGWLLSIIQKHHIDFIIPGIECDLYQWNKDRAEIEKSGAKILLNNPDLIALCEDKWLFHNALAEKNTTHLIASSLEANFEALSARFGLPFLLKPRRGFGSKGIVRIHNAAEFAAYQNMMGEMLLAQPIVGTDNEEFTTSAFCDGQGGFYAYMTLRRKLSKDGFTEKAEVVTDIDDIQSTLTTLCEHFRPLGPTNFQFRRHHGILKLLEINPRISSSTSIRAAFGYNESCMAVNYYLDGIPPVQPVIHQGRAVRYVEDLIFLAEPAL